MNLEDLKFIQKELHEAYEMNDKILIGYAINRLDTLIFEETQQLQKGNIPNVNSTVKNCEETASELRKFARVIADIKSMFDELEIYGSLDEECRQRMEKKLCCDIDEIADHYFDLGQKDIQKGLQKLLGIRF
jgi:hypothetical protein